MLAMMEAPWAFALAGFGMGLLVACAAGWYATRVLTRRARQAEGRARAAEHLAEIGSMTGGLAHEIKNPLSTIAMNAQLLAEAIEEAGGLDEQERLRMSRRASTLRREVERLGDILGDFLEFAGELRLSPSREDLNTVVEELADFFLPQAESQQVRLRVELLPEPAWVWVDAKRLKQALLNLMLNAVQAMAQAPEGTPRELMLRVRRRGQGGRLRGPRDRHRAGHRPGDRRTHLPPLLHHQGRRQRPGTAHEPADHTGQRRRAALPERAGPGHGLCDRPARGCAAGRAGLSRPAQPGIVGTAHATA
ncbi:MAG: hypothetical protein KatS3mg103_0700 [Phycisphaerales bacterium]|nr:MAG: hypothetical protein KatS3mg103_0700 [Phycisphaerales bacterium]